MVGDYQPRCFPFTFGVRGWESAGTNSTILSDKPNKETESVYEFLADKNQDIIAFSKPEDIRKYYTNYNNLVDSSTLVVMICGRKVLYYVGTDPINMDKNRAYIMGDKNSGENIMTTNDGDLLLTNNEKNKVLLHFSKATGELKTNPANGDELFESVKFGILQNNKDSSNFLGTLAEKRQALISSCSGIHKKLKEIENLTAASTFLSGASIGASGGALGFGITKDLTEKKSLKEGLTEAEEKKALDEKEKTSVLTGHIRTGTMGVAAATSAGSTGTSIASAVGADKLIKQMKDCNKKISEIRLIKSEMEAEDPKSVSTTELIVVAKNLTESCQSFDVNVMEQIKGSLIGSSVTSGIGALSAITGTTTSAIANTKKVREDDSSAGIDKEKKLNLASNITAGITAGASLGGTVLSMTVIKKLKDNMDKAKLCEDGLK